MRFVVIYLVLAIIIYVRGICPVIHDRRKRLWCLLAVLPGAFFPSVTRFIGGSMVAPDLPVWVMYAGSIFQNFTLLVGILVIGREILSVPLRIIGLPFPYLGRSRIVAGTILGLSVAFSCLGMFKSVISGCQGPARRARRPAHCSVERPACFIRLYARSRRRDR